MNVNILDAIMNIVKDPVINVKEYSDSRNRANSMGAALEEYIKDMFYKDRNDYRYYKRFLADMKTYGSGWLWTWLRRGLSS